ncbi:MAG: hypothetical protein GIW99_09930 [Candidatus Eremiobacteraeota bacterium]|nr:hypothetical protein [Candidatus Eremiobacteraeota bacterium]MBC5827981.1 hypothetical protein [Candidatus Eremiobacteraeota bacterium]
MSKRLAYVDGLRAVAVLCVVAHHAAKYCITLRPGVLAHVFSKARMVWTCSS